MICPSCSHRNPPRARFCNECGARLGERAQPEPVVPRAYTPEHLREQILRTRAALEGERKQVTVLFADVKGSTEIAERVDAEEWHALLDRFFSILAQGVHRHEGTVNQFTGDGIMALFGAPLAHEDHARRACHAALELRDELRRFSEQLRVERGIDFAVRMGLHSGEVVVGKIGDDLRMDYTAQGATVNLAARMEHLAAPGQVYATEQVARLGEGYFRFRSLGPTRVKGVEEAVQVYELEAFGDARSRFDLSRRRGLSSFVGREAEVALLEEALARLEEGIGSVVAIVGEAGVGKSRLSHEIAARCRRRSIRVVHATCAPHGQAVPLMVALELLRSSFGLGPDDSDEVARDKVAGRVARLAPEHAGALPLLLDFLGIPDPAQRTPEVAPETVLGRLRELVLALQRAFGARESTLILVEDLHWIDPASESLLGALLAEAPATRTLAVVNYRPEYARSLAQETRVVPLAPLSTDGAERLLSHLLGPAAAETDLVAWIRGHAGGNPFFVEEIVQSLAESGALVGSTGAYRLLQPLDRIAIPPTVHGLLAARIDRLGEVEKDVLQSAAVLGKSFEAGTLPELTGLSSGHLETVLEGLARAGLVDPEGDRADGLWSFRHPLTQEVAERSLLSDRRRRLHATAAAVLERRHAARLDENAALIGYHAEAAGEPVSAARWLRRAALWLERRDYPGALRHWRRVAALLGRWEESPETFAFRREVAGAMLRIGLRVGLEAHEREALIGEVRRAREQLGIDDPGDAALMMALPATIQVMEGDGEAPIATLEQARDAAAAAGDRRVLVAVTALLAVAQLYSGRLADCVQATEPFVSGPLDDPRIGSGIFTTNPYLLLLAMRSNTLRESGRLAEARAVAEQAAALARELDDPENLVLALVALVDMWLESGEPDRAGPLAREALRTAEGLGSSFARSLAFSSIGLVEAADGRWQAAALAYERSLMLLRETRFGLPDEAFRLGLLAQAVAALGEQDRARVMIEQAIALAEERHARLALAWTRRIRAEILLRARDRDLAAAAEESALAAIEAARAIGARMQEALALIELSGAAQLAGDPSRSTRILTQACAQLREIGATGQVARLEEALRQTER